jgi:hypothetical protein
MSKESVEKKLKKLGYNDAAIAGILGNISVETADTFNYKTQQVGGPGYGLLQLDFMKPYYEKWKKQNKIKDSADAQLKFFHETVYGGSQDVIGAGNAAKLRNVLDKEENPAVIADVLAKGWFKPNPERNPKYDERAQYALQMSGYQPPVAPAPQPEPAWWENPLARTKSALGSLFD